MKETIKTPCIGVCSTGIGDEVCRGCKRFSHEVIRWNSYSNLEREAIFARLDNLLAKVVESKIEIFNQQQLSAKMREQQIFVDDERSPYCWVFDLLKAGASQIADLKQFGCKTNPGWENKELVEIKNAIDADYFTLSSAHYERYFQQAASAIED